MVRPRSLGPNITFRLPIDLHELAVERAEANGETVDEYVRRRFVDALERTRAVTATPDIYGRGKVEPRWKKPVKDPKA